MRTRASEATGEVTEWACERGKLKPRCKRHRVVRVSCGRPRVRRMPAARGMPVDRRSRQRVWPDHPSRRRSVRQRASGALRHDVCVCGHVHGGGRQGHSSHRHFLERILDGYGSNPTIRDNWEHPHFEHAHHGSSQWRGGPLRCCLGAGNTLGVTQDSVIAGGSTHRGWGSVGVRQLAVVGRSTQIDPLLPVANGRFEDWFAPHDARVYRFRK